MEPVLHYILKLWASFWMLWPKNFYFLILMSAMFEALSVISFKLSGNRGILSLLGYTSGFFVLAFYAEAQKYSKVLQAYPFWISSAAVLIIVGSVFILKENVSPVWLLGLALTIVGVIIMNMSLPVNS